VTLNITMVGPDIVMQASDRRMTMDGQVVDDEANKAIVLRCSDGILGITFTGVGRAADERVDLWLAKLLLDKGVPELSVSDAPQAICDAASRWFSTFPTHWEKRHAFIIAGWLLAEKPKPVQWWVHNCLGDNRAMLPAARDSFSVMQVSSPSGRTGRIAVTGLAGAV
jgi:hypothetical protein